MNVLQADYLSVLADSGWGELIPLLFIVGVSVISAITKALAKSDESAKSEKAKTSRLIEMAKRYKQMQETGQIRDVLQEDVPYARTAKTPAERTPHAVSEWDRRQQEKKQQVQIRHSQQPGHYTRYTEKTEPPVFQPQQKIPIDVPIPVAQPIRPAYQPPKIQPEPRPKRASQPVRQQSQAIPTAMPVTHQPSVKMSSGKPHNTAVHPGQTLKALLENKQSLRSAFILKEILDKPVALRDTW